MATRKHTAVRKEVKSATRKAAHTAPQMGTDALALQVVRGGLERTQQAIQRRAERIVATTTTKLPNGDFRVDDSPLAQDAFALVMLLSRMVREQEAVRHWTARIQAVQS